MPRRAEDGFRAIRVIRAKIYMHVVVFRKNIAKIIPRKSAMSPNVSKCRQMSLNVFKRGEKEGLMLGGVVENSYLYGVILHPILGEIQKS